MPANSTPKTLVPATREKGGHKDLATPKGNTNNTSDKKQQRLTNHERRNHKTEDMLPKRRKISMSCELETESVGLSCLYTGRTKPLRDPKAQASTDETTGGSSSWEESEMSTPPTSRQTVVKTTPGSNTGSTGNIKRGRGRPRKGSHVDGERTNSVIAKAVPGRCTGPSHSARTTRSQSKTTPVNDLFDGTKQTNGHGNSPKSDSRSKGQVRKSLDFNDVSSQRVTTSDQASIGENNVNADFETLTATQSERKARDLTSPMVRCPVGSTKTTDSRLLTQKAQHRNTPSSKLTPLKGSKPFTIVDDGQHSNNSDNDHTYCTSRRTRSNSGKTATTLPPAKAGPPQKQLERKHNRHGDPMDALTPLPIMNSKTKSKEDATNMEQQITDHNHVQGGSRCMLHSTMDEEKKSDLATEIQDGNSKCIVKSIGVHSSTKCEAQQTFVVNESRAGEKVRDLNEKRPKLKADDKWTGLECKGRIAEGPSGNTSTVEETKSVRQTRSSGKASGTSAYPKSLESRKRKRRSSQPSIDTPEKVKAVDLQSNQTKPTAEERTKPSRVISECGKCDPNLDSTNEKDTEQSKDSEAITRRAGKWFKVRCPKSTKLVSLLNASIPPPATENTRVFSEAMFHMPENTCVSTEAMSLSTGNTPVSTEAMSDVTENTRVSNHEVMSLTTGNTLVSSEAMSVTAEITCESDKAMSFTAMNTRASSEAMSLKPVNTRVSNEAMSVTTENTCVADKAMSLTAKNTPASGEAVSLSTGNTCVSTEAMPLTTENKCVSTEARPLSAWNTRASREAMSLSTGNSRVSTEAMSISTGNTCVSTEAMSISTENTRVSTEAMPLTTENTCVSTEVMSLSTGNTCVSDEAMSLSTENTRVSSEAMALSAGNSRVSSEAMSLATGKTCVSTEAKSFATGNTCVSNEQMSLSTDYSAASQKATCVENTSIPTADVSLSAEDNGVSKECVSLPQKNISFPKGDVFRPAEITVPAKDKCHNTCVSKVHATKGRKTGILKEGESIPPGNTVSRSWDIPLSETNLISPAFTNEGNTLLDNTPDKVSDSLQDLTSETLRSETVDVSEETTKTCKKTDCKTGSNAVCTGNKCEHFTSVKVPNCMEKRHLSEVITSDRPLPNSSGVAPTVVELPTQDTVGRETVGVTRPQVISPVCDDSVIHSRIPNETKTIKSDIRPDENHSDCSAKSITSVYENGKSPKMISPIFKDRTGSSQNFGVSRMTGVLPDGQESCGNPRVSDNHQTESRNKESSLSSISTCSAEKHLFNSATTSTIVHNSCAAEQTSSSNPENAEERVTPKRSSRLQRKTQIATPKRYTDFYVPNLRKKPSPNTKEGEQTASTPLAKNKEKKENTAAHQFITKLSSQEKDKLTKTCGISGSFNDGYLDTKSGEVTQTDSKPIASMGPRTDVRTVYCHKPSVVERHLDVQAEVQQSHFREMGKTSATKTANEKAVNADDVIPKHISLKKREKLRLKKVNVKALSKSKFTGDSSSPGALVTDDVTNTWQRTKQDDPKQRVEQNGRTGRDGVASLSADITGDASAKIKQHSCNKSNPLKLRFHRTSQGLAIVSSYLASAIGNNHNTTPALSNGFAAVQNEDFHVKQKSNRLKKGKKPKAVPKSVLNIEDYMDNDMLANHAFTLWNSEKGWEIRRNLDGKTRCQPNSIRRESFDTLPKDEQKKYFLRALAALTDENKHSPESFTLKLPAALVSDQSESVLQSAHTKEYELEKALERKLCVFRGMAVSKQHSLLRQNFLYVQRMLSKEEYGGFVTTIKTVLRDQRSKKQEAYSQGQDDLEQESRDVMFCEVLRRRNALKEAALLEKVHAEAAACRQFELFVRQLIVGEEVTFDPSVKCPNLRQTLVDLQDLERKSRVSVSGDVVRSDSFENLVQDIEASGEKCCPAADKMATTTSGEDVITGASRMDGIWGDLPPLDEHSGLVERLLLERPHQELLPLNTSLLEHCLQAGSPNVSVEGTSQKLTGDLMAEAVTAVDSLMAGTPCCDLNSPSCILSSLLVLDKCSNGNPRSCI